MTKSNNIAPAQFDILVKPWNNRPAIFKKFKNKDGAEVEILLTDCVITMLAWTGGGLDSEYLLQVEGEEGQKWQVVVNSKDLTSTAAFKRIIRPYSFLGKDAELEYLIMFLRASVKHQLILLKDYTGRYQDKTTDFWVLADRIQFVKPQKQAWIDTTLPEAVVFKTERKRERGEQISFEDYALYFKRPPTERQEVSFALDDKWYFVINENLSSDFRPQMLPPIPEAKQVTTEELLIDWGKQYGNTWLCYNILGWFVSVAYMQEVLELRKSQKFPLFALSGLTQSGKTSLIANLFKFWGVSATPSDYTQMSFFAELKQLTQAHNFPIWRDEFRNAGKALEKETMLRSLYDRSAIYKGTASQQLLSYKTNSTLFLSGEGVTIDPAVRRRFIYSDLQSRFKLSPEKWKAAEIWSAEFAPELFLRAIENGFNTENFLKIWNKEEKLNTINDPQEEKLCIASLAAVFGLEFGEKIWEMARTFWIQSKTDFAEIDRAKINMVEQFFEFCDSQFTNLGFYEAKNFMGASTLPMILNYFGYQRGSLYIKLAPLIQFMYVKGFNKSTTFDEWGLRAAIKGLIGGKNVRKRIGWKVTNLVEVRLEDIPEDSSLFIIAAIVVEICGQPSSSGRMISDEVGVISNLQEMNMRIYDQIQTNKQQQLTGFPPEESQN